MGGKGQAKNKADSTKARKGGGGAAAGGANKPAAGGGGRGQPTQISGVRRSQDPALWFNDQRFNLSANSRWQPAPFDKNLTFPKPAAKVQVDLNGRFLPATIDLAVLSTLNGFYSKTTGYQQWYQTPIMSVYEKVDCKKWLNVRWPRELLMPIFDFAQIICENSLKPDHWKKISLKTLKKAYDYNSLKYGKKTKGCIWDLMREILTEIGKCYEKNTIRWASTETLFIPYPPERKLEPGDFHWVHHALHGAWKYGKSLLEPITPTTPDDTRSFADPSLIDLQDVIYAVLQSCCTMCLGVNVSEEIWDYHDKDMKGPKIDAFVEHELYADSDTQFASDITLKILISGNIPNYAPFSIKASGKHPQTQEDVGKVWKYEELKAPGQKQKPENIVEIAWENWCGFPQDVFIFLEIYPEDGSRLEHDEDRKLGTYVYIPRSEPLDFTLVDNEQMVPKYPDTVLFCKSLGDGKGLHYRFRLPLEIYGRPGYLIQVENRLNKKTYRIPMTNCKDVEFWMYAMANDDNQLGYGGLGYARCGFERPAVNMKNYVLPARVQNTRCIPKMKFQVSVGLVQGGRGQPQ